ncbi:hypothetical protein HFO15_19555 [Rhizobium laguerreae]|uniref:hypothetical protein n=1 Tax=Rhizobium laguerreae TaxID=1076926 RepID=UPI001C91DAF4|nr:hypothetical protein [Rhizobium laguerreae]MBY3263825.1 hypothetical protein [Rhizobium laguerreae]
MTRRQTTAPRSQTATTTTAYTPSTKPPYTGSGTEVVDGLTVTHGVPAERLIAVARWHERDRFGRERHGRHEKISARLRQVANDNGRAA